MSKGKRHILPGFRLTMGFALTYLSIIVLFPFVALALKSASLTGEEFWHAIAEEQVVASYKVSFGISALAALTNGFFGFIVAWVMVRYNFPFKKILDSFVDLPFALPTAVAGISLAALYARTGWVGQYLSKIGIEGAYSRFGIYIALTFIGLPFVVRTLQPVLQDLSSDIEEAAATLGANRWQTFWRVIFPVVLPAFLTGMILAFGRAVGEYGSVIFISSNIPGYSQITPQLIITKLEQYDYGQAAAIGVVMLAASFVILALVNLIQLWNAKRSAKA